MIGVKTGIFAGKVEQPYDGNYRWWLDVSNAITSNVLGVDYIDSIQLENSADKFIQPTAADRAAYSVISSMPFIDTTGTVSPAVRRLLYLNNDDIIFPSATGTLSFLFNVPGASGTGQSLFLNAPFNASFYNLQIIINAAGELIGYTSTDFLFLIDSSSIINNWFVVHFVLNSGTMDYYKNGVFQGNFSIAHPFTTPANIALFNYVGVSSEQAYGYFSDYIATSDAKSALQVAENYQWYKRRYSFLP